MEALRQHRGQVVPLDRPNVDTDQIIPKQFLKRIERTGYGDFLFFDWRQTPSGDPIPGLYAAGEAAGFGGGGMHGRRSLEGTFLGGCVFSGRIAARAIANERYSPATATDESPAATPA